VNRMFEWVNVRSKWICINCNSSAVVYPKDECICMNVARSERGNSCLVEFLLWNMCVVLLDDDTHADFLMII